jgi:hypothetical protein
MQYGAQQGLGEPEVFEIHSFSWVMVPQEKVSDSFNKQACALLRGKESDTSSGITENETFPGPNAGEAMQNRRTQELLELAVVH